MFTVREAAEFRRRLLIAMSMQEAKEILGFPPGYVPSPREVNKAYKALALKNHPDRGGDPRKMVELNVAKEVMEGKRHDRFRPGPEPDPEEERRRREREEQERKRKASIRVIEDQLEIVQYAVNSLLHYLRTNFGKTWRVDLREYLVDEMPDKLDKLLNAADRLLAGDLDAKSKRNWQRTQRLTEVVMGLGLRVAKKFREMAHLLARATDKELSYSELEIVAGAVPEFLTAFQALDKRSGELASLVMTADEYGGAGDTLYEQGSVDLDLPGDVHRMVTAYRNDFAALGKYLEKDGTKLGEKIENAVEVVKKELAEWSLGNRTPWHDWEIPGDFMAAIDLLTKQKTAATASVEERVAARHMWGQSTSTPASSRSARTRRPL